MLLQSSGIMCNCLCLKQDKGNCNIIENLTKTTVTHIETNQLTCTANKFTYSYIRQCFTITHKQTSSFICFDVENFYPSISSNLFYLKNRLNLQDSSSRFLMMIYQSLCRPEKPSFLKVQHPRLKRVVMRISTLQWVVSS